jgi:hypothetical protein
VFAAFSSAKRASGQPGSRRLIYADETRIRRHRNDSASPRMCEPASRTPP